MAQKNQHQYSAATPYKQQSLIQTLDRYLPSLAGRDKTAIIDATAGHGAFVDVHGKVQIGSPLHIMRVMRRANGECCFYAVERNAATFEYLKYAVETAKRALGITDAHAIFGDHRLVIPSILQDYAAGLIYIDFTVFRPDFISFLTKEYPYMDLLLTYGETGFSRPAACHGTPTLGECLRSVREKWYLNPWYQRLPKNTGRQWHWGHAFGASRADKSLEQSLASIGYEPL